MDVAIENMATSNAVDFSIALLTRRPLAARSPPQTISGFAHSGSKLGRGNGLDSHARLHQRSEISAVGPETLEAFAGIAPQYGMLPQPTAWPRLCSRIIPPQVVITGAADDAVAKALESAAKFCVPLGQVRLARTAGLRTRFLAACSSRNLATSSQSRGPGNRLRRQHLLPADQRSQTTQRTGYGQTQLGCCQLIRRALNKKTSRRRPAPPARQFAPSVRRTYFFGRDSGGTSPLLR